MEKSFQEAVVDTVETALTEVKNEAAASAKQAICWTCPVKDACKRALVFCKKNKVCLAIGVAIATAAIIYKTIPAVKEQVDALFGVDAADQTENFDADEHSLPQQELKDSEEGPGLV